MNLNISRNDACNLAIACTCIIVDMREELQSLNPKPTESRAKVLGESIKKWERIRETIRNQVEAAEME